MFLVKIIPETLSFALNYIHVDIYDYIKTFYNCVMLTDHRGRYFNSIFVGDCRGRDRMVVGAESG